ncbi:YitT family protein [soil metagenome]
MALDLVYLQCKIMNRFVKQLLLRTTLKTKRRKTGKAKDFSAYEMAKAWREMKINIHRHIKDIILITAGIFSAAFGFKGFLLTNHFIDGGATGISLLISALTHVPLYLLLILINIPFILLGFKIIGKAFAIKTALAISGLALVVATVTFPNVTNDNLLVAVFGGFFLGAGIGLSVRGGAVIDGTEVLAIFLSRKFGTTIGDIIIAINIVIFSTAAYFLSVEIALYSMVTYLAASKTLDFIIEGIEEYTGVTIISSHSEEIRGMIINTMGRGVTVYNGKRGYGKQGESKDIDIVYSVVTRLELNRLNNEIQKIDPNAFVIMSSVKDTKGGMIKKRPLKH